MDIERLVNVIIPPSNYRHRNGFNNIPLIDGLTTNEKIQLEDALIDKLSLSFESAQEEIDVLIIETLAYLKSQKSLSVLKQILEKSYDDMTKLIIAVSIFEINRDDNMIEVAISSFRKLDDDKNPYYVYTLPTAFSYLIKFKNSKVNSVIEEYSNHKEYLIAYNAKQVLGNR